MHEIMLLTVAFALGAALLVAAARRRSRAPSATRR